MNLLKYINIPVLCISFILGLFAVYITVPEKRKIIIYPHKDNADIIQYRDKTDTCFALKEKEVICPNNKEEIFKIPIQQ